MRCAALAALLLLAVAAPAAAFVCDGVTVDCTLNDLGNDTYEFVFTVVNGSPEPNAIFFWVLNPGNVPQSWETIEWILPEGWTASHPGPQLHFFATSNSSSNPSRMFSPTASTCGELSYEFRWIFSNDGGPTPVCDFTLLDFTFHMQGIDPGLCANVGDSFVCPEPVPTQLSTWGRIKQLYDDQR